MVHCSKFVVLFQKFSSIFIGRWFGKLGHCSSKRVLVNQSHQRPADSLRLEGDAHLDAVGDLDERNAAVQWLSIGNKLQSGEKVAEARLR
jgi:hypothetical protein